MLYNVFYYLLLYYYFYRITILYLYIYIFHFFSEPVEEDTYQDPGFEEGEFSDAEDGVS